MSDKQPWSETVIWVDTGYLERTMAGMKLFFEKQLHRALPQGDLCCWIESVLLDTGLHPGNHEVQVLLLHDEDHTSLSYFTPADFSTELDAKAFRSVLGEIRFNAITVERRLVSPMEFYGQTLDVLLNETTIKTLAIIPDREEYGAIFEERATLFLKKDCSFFTLPPVETPLGTNVNLGFSLLRALGVSPDELG